MVRRLGLPLFLVLAACLVSDGAWGGGSETREDAEGNRYVSGELLVRYTDGATEEQIRSLEQRHGFVPLRKIEHLRLRHYALPDSLEVPEAIDRLRAEEAVRYAEPNYLHETRALPSDPRFPDQWALHNTGQTVNGLAGVTDADIDLPEALDRHGPSSEPVVAILDTGVALDHPELLPRIWLNQGEVAGSLEPNGLDDDGNGYIDDFFGWDFFDGDAGPGDESGHGTLVASQVSSVSGNGVGGVGVSEAARIMPVRIADDFGNFGLPFTNTVLFLLATTYAAENGASIVNYSAGGAPFSIAVRDQLDWLDSQGILFVAAAGNGGSDRTGDDNDVTPVYPASYSGPNILSVAATDQSDQLAVFSNFGSTTVDLAAPGSNIFGAGVSRSTTYLETFEGPVNWTVGNACLFACDDWALFEDFFGNTWANDSMDLFTGEPLTYLNDTDAWIESPWLALPAAGPQLEYRLWHDLEFFDLGLVEVSTDGVTWDVKDLVYRTSATAPPGTALPAGGIRAVDLSQLAGLTMKLRFTLVSDSIFVADGLYVDDVRITRVDVFDFDGDEFAFNDGTSFAAPLVAGVAAMVWSERPELTHRQVRSILLESVDPLPSLSGMVASGGRVNANAAVEAAVEFVPEPGRRTGGAAALGGLVLMAFRGSGERWRSGFPRAAAG